MRVIAGEFRGRKLAPVRARGIRPTSDKVREAVFSILQDRVRGAAVLDLFAGTGAMGIEALSRGAASAVFTDTNREARALVEANLDALGIRDRARVLALDALAGLSHPALARHGFGIVFVDPPYFEGAHARALENLSRAELVAPEGVVVVEHSRRAEAGFGESCFEVTGTRRYGKTLVSFLEPVI